MSNKYVTSHKFVTDTSKPRQQGKIRKSYKEFHYLIDQIVDSAERDDHEYRLGVHKCQRYDGQIIARCLSEVLYRMKSEEQERDKLTSGVERILFSSLSYEEEKLLAHHNDKVCLGYNPMRGKSQDPKWMHSDVYSGKYHSNCRYCREEYDEYKKKMDVVYRKAEHDKQDEEAWDKARKYDELMESKQDQ